MTIKTGRIRRKFDEALQDRILSDNMLLMSISALNNEIQYNESISDQKAANYIKYRNQLAKLAIDKGISKNKITEAMKTLSAERYPSYNQILKKLELIKNYSYQYIADYIPDSDMKYKSDTELHDINSQPVVKRNQGSINSEQQINEICEYINKNFNIDITADMQAKIRAIQTNNEVILQTLKWYINDIDKAINNKRFDSNYDKLCYIIGVISKKIPDTVSELERREKKQKEFWNDNATPIINGEMTLEEMVSLHCDDDKSANFGKHDYVRTQLLQAIERLKK